MVTSDFRPKVEIRPFRACAMHPAIIIGTVRALWTCMGQIPRSTSERISSLQQYYGWSFIKSVKYTVCQIVNKKFTRVIFAIDFPACIWQKHS